MPLPILKSYPTKLSSYKVDCSCRYIYIPVAIPTDFFDKKTAIDITSANVIANCTV